MEKNCDKINPILEEISSLKFDFFHVESFWQSQSDYRPTGWIAEILFRVFKIDDLSINTLGYFVSRTNTWFFGISTNDSVCICSYVSFDDQTMCLDK